MMVVVEIDYYRKQVDFKPNLQRKAFNIEANWRKEEFVYQDLDKVNSIVR